MNIMDAIAGNQPVNWIDYHSNEVWFSYYDPKVVPWYMTTPAGLAFTYFWASIADLARTGAA